MCFFFLFSSLLIPASIFFMVIEWLRIVVYVHWNDRRLIISGVKIFSTNNCHLALWPPVNKWNFSTAHVFTGLLNCRAQWCWFVPFKVINFFSEYHKLWNIFLGGLRDLLCSFEFEVYVNCLQKFLLYLCFHVIGFGVSVISKYAQNYAINLWMLTLLAITVDFY